MITFEVAKSLRIFQQAFAAWSTTYHRLNLSSNLKSEDKIHHGFLFWPTLPLWGVLRRCYECMCQRPGNGWGKPFWELTAGYTLPFECFIFPSGVQWPVSLALLKQLQKQDLRPSTELLRVLSREHMWVGAVVEEGQPGFNKSRAKGYLRGTNTPRCSECLLSWIQAQCSGSGHVRPSGATEGRRSTWVAEEDSPSKERSDRAIIVGILTRQFLPAHVQVHGCLLAWVSGSQHPKVRDIFVIFRCWIVEDRGANGCTCFVWCRGGRRMVCHGCWATQLAPGPLPGLMWTRWCLTRSCMA